MKKTLFALLALVALASTSFAARPPVQWVGNETAGKALFENAPFAKEIYICVGQKNRFTEEHDDSIPGVSIFIITCKATGKRVKLYWYDAQGITPHGYVDATTLE